MILPREKTLHYLRYWRGDNPPTVRTPDGKPIPFPQDDLPALIQEGLAVGVGNERKLSYVLLKFFSRISHHLSQPRNRPLPSYSSEASRTWLEWAPGQYEPHPYHCAAFSPENKETFV
jgi:hypothetical protein